MGKTTTVLGNIPIREYNEGMDVQLEMSTDKPTLMLVAFCEAGFKSVRLDLKDIIKFVNSEVFADMFSDLAFYYGLGVDNPLGVLAGGKGETNGNN